MFIPIVAKCLVNDINALKPVTLETLLSERGAKNDATLRLEACHRARDKAYADLEKVRKELGDTKDEMKLVRDKATLRLQAEQGRHELTHGKKHALCTLQSPVRPWEPKKIRRESFSKNAGLSVVQCLRRSVVQCLPQNFDLGSSKKVDAPNSRFHQTVRQFIRKSVSISGGLVREIKKIHFIYFHEHVFGYNVGL